MGALPCTLKFIVKDIDPTKGEPADDETGYDDEYNLEELEIVAADFMKKVPVAAFEEAWLTDPPTYQLTHVPTCLLTEWKQVPVVDFKEAWSTIGADCEIVETFALTYSSIRQAMDAVVDFLGMQPCDASDKPAEDARMHTTLLSGLFLGGVQVCTCTHARMHTPHTPHAARRTRTHAHAHTHTHTHTHTHIHTRIHTHTCTQVFAIVNLRVDSPKAVGMRLTVRSTDSGISQFVASSVA